MKNKKLMTADEAMKRKITFELFTELSKLNWLKTLQEASQIKEIAEYMLSKDAIDYDEEKLALYINLIPEDVEGLNKLRSEIESLVKKYEKKLEFRPLLI